MSAGQFGDIASDRRCLNLTLFIPGITVSIIVSVRWLGPTEGRCHKPACVYRKTSKVIGNEKAKTQREIKVFRKSLCGPLRRYKLQRALKLCFEANFRFFDRVGVRPWVGTVDMKRKSVAVGLNQACTTGPLPLMFSESKKESV